MKTKLIILALISVLLGGCVAVPVSHVPPPPPTTRVVVVQEYPYPYYYPVFFRFSVGHVFHGGHRPGPWRR